MQEDAGKTHSIPQGASLSDEEKGFLESTTYNKIYFYSDITPDRILMLTKMLQEKIDDFAFKKQIWSLAENPILHLHIQSYGGLVHSALATYDAIKTSKIPIHTYVDGVSASAATLLNIAGTKRFIYENSFMLIHQVRMEYWGTFTHQELSDDQKNSENLMKALKKIYLESTKLKESKIDELMKHDLYFSAEECLEHGLVDEIVGR